MRVRATAANAFVLAVSLGVLNAAPQTDRRLPASSYAPERRLALVVGNDAYTQAPLRNARNDARAIASALEELSFHVTRVEDATLTALGRALATFGDALRPDAVAVFYFAGHGVQVDNENFLIPVDYQGDSAQQLRYVTVRASEVERMLARARVGVLVLDACRNNPYGGTRGGGTGLAVMSAEGTLVAFAAAASQTASDNPAGANGLFTAELVKVLREPGLTMREVFYRVRERVYTASRQRQRPAVYDNLIGGVVLRPGAATAVLPSAAGADLARREDLFWDSIKDSRDARVFEDYLARYPAGQYRVIAQSRLDELRAASKPAPPAGGASSATRPPASLSGAAGRRAGETRGDPKMPGLQWAFIPAGMFLMGCVPGDAECHGDEKPRHQVTLTKAFELMTTEVTVGMWRAYARSGGAALPPQPDWSRSDGHPVVNIDWSSAQTFCRWVSGRLPTEAEREYAARGGREGLKYTWGNDAPVCQKGAPNGARFDDDGGCDAEAAATRGADSVGSYAPNGYGLYDMAGNVWEWVSDWYASGYPRRAVTDPSGPSSGQSRVVRGGSWLYFPWNLRASDRYNLTPDSRFFSFGLRCARDVFP